MGNGIILVNPQNPHSHQLGNQKRIPLRDHQKQMEETNLCVCHLVNIQVAVNFFPLNKENQWKRPNQSQKRIKTMFYTLPQDCHYRPFCQFFSGRRRFVAILPQCWPPSWAVLALTDLWWWQLFSEQFGTSNSPYHWPPSNLSTRTVSLGVKSATHTKLMLIFEGSASEDG